MENARIAVFEDSEGVRTSLSLVLERLGHQVVAQLATMEEAREYIQGMDEDTLDVAIVDGNMSKGSVNSEDGAEITSLIKSKSSSAIVIGHSGSDDVIGADLNLTKGNPSQVINAIDDL